MNLGNSLFHARKRCGLSQEEVAEKLGVSRQTISRALLKNTEKSSAVRKLHGCVVVLDGRQPACVLRLALQSPSSLPFFSLF